ncbi:uncharacterized protein BYT42DRAFT_573536 [Radiomyces spectabilis]|uniref:uncharacterized protein n=1 Tax=Radiomyces spectabilis TaxID=64574 RepID=UPI0022203517|nr:uncharacterized protein BYT42DRAFT_573536 [Radiomyces spectabilis]KAI8376134.1 hypothetical protein BYT42DRAFT_573536 [Radiomyces spectabilis]
MFSPPNPTLRTSLHTVLENPHHYLADVTFHFSSGALGAHRAILLARTPETFRKRYLPELTNNSQSTSSVLQIDLSAIFSKPLFAALLRFWYTADWLPLSLTASPDKENPTSTLCDPSASIMAELNALELRLGMPLFPRPGDNQSDYDQLLHDLTQMRSHHLATDVLITVVPHDTDLQDTADSSDTANSSDAANLSGTAPQPFRDHSSLLSLPRDVATPAGILRSSSSYNQLGDTSFLSSSSTIVSFPAHRFLLAAQSTYFYALFCSDFSEATCAEVRLTDDLFSPVVLDVILHYLYTDSIHVTPSPTTARLTGATQRRLSHKKHILRVLQKVFFAADYLAHFDTISVAALCTMAATCHQFKCTCGDCAALLPSMLSFADNNVNSIPSMRPLLISHYSDPVHSIASLWAQKPFAILISSIATENSASSTLALTQESDTVIKKISDLTLHNVTKHNAIHVLHSLHLCLSQLRGADPIPSWSLPTLDLLDPILHHAVMMVSQHFDFYCVEYPILLSCVDGIGFGFSIDFLDFLLKRVLEEGIHDINAGIIYQGIVRDLVGRQEVVKNVALDGVLLEARSKCASYLCRRWLSVKTQGGFSTIDKDVMRQMAIDTGIPYRTLSKPFDSDFSTIFSFKPKAAKTALRSKMSEVETGGAAILKAYGGGGHHHPSPRRLSLGSLKPQRSSGALQPLARTSSTQPSRSMTRPRSRSTESALEHALPSTGSYVAKSSVDALSSQPLIHLLSLETEARLYKQERSKSVPPEVLSSSVSAKESLSSLVEALLPLDPPIMSKTLPSKPTTARSLNAADTTTHDTTPRPSRLKFALPATPLRAVKSPYIATNGVASQVSSSGRKSGKPSRRSRWNIGSGSDVSDDDEPTMVTPVIGAKVELLRRPLPTLGVIKYIGPVNFAKGTWVGVELESRLGKSDGSTNGVRYFYTDQQRGVFVKPDDFRILSLPLRA